MPLFDLKCHTCNHTESDKYHSHWSDMFNCPDCGTMMIKLPALIAYSGDPSFTYAEKEVNGKIVERMKIPRPEKPKDSALKRGEHG